ncbi:hypothetical protein GF1_05440 [Desulfolithobacter dissulfuricans]|uniref:Uncharacterized protein n=2 Tax=Desulfolithobacter dissulfuricans TaxID=2795293 RepID=A0A915TY62_9BACT|nr:hypothetical protein GF1_05440 [Desulfolithobacter dissulfuricans]
MGQGTVTMKEEISRLRNRVIRSVRVNGPFWTGMAAVAWPCGQAGAAGPTEIVPVENIIATSTPIAITFMLSVMALKITAFVLGYLIVRLGHDTLLKGVTGEIDFGFSGSGFKTKLQAASPGALFVLMGAAIIIWGLTVKKPMEIKAVPPSGASVSEAAAKGAETLHRVPVPD